MSRKKISRLKKKKKWNENKRTRLSKSGSYIGSWEVSGIVKSNNQIVDRKIPHYLRQKQKIYIGMLNNHINYTFIYKNLKNKIK